MEISTIILISLVGISVILMIIVLLTKSKNSSTGGNSTTCGTVTCPNITIPPCPSAGGGGGGPSLQNVSVNVGSGSGMITRKSLKEQIEENQIEQYGKVLTSESEKFTYAEDSQNQQGFIEVKWDSLKASSKPTDDTLIYAIVPVMPSTADNKFSHESKIVYSKDANVFEILKVTTSGSIITYTSLSPTKFVTNDFGKEIIINWTHIINNNTNYKSSLTGTLSTDVPLIMNNVKASNRLTKNSGFTIPIIIAPTRENLYVTRWTIDTTVTSAPVWKPVAVSVTPAADAEGQYTVLGGEIRAQCKIKTAANGTTAAVLEWVTPTSLLTVQTTGTEVLPKISASPFTEGSIKVVPDVTLMKFVFASGKTDAIKVNFSDANGKLYAPFLTRGSSIKVIGDDYYTITNAVLDSADGVYNITLNRNITNSSVKYFIPNNAIIFIYSGLKNTNMDLTKTWIASSLREYNALQDKFFDPINVIVSARANHRDPTGLNSVGGGLLGADEPFQNNNMDPQIPDWWDKINPEINKLFVSQTSSLGRGIDLRTTDLSDKVSDWNTKGACFGNVNMKTDNGTSVIFVDFSKVYHGNTFKHISHDTMSSSESVAACFNAGGAGSYAGVSMKATTKIMFNSTNESSKDIKSDLVSYHKEYAMIKMNRDCYVSNSITDFPMSNLIGISFFTTMAAAVKTAALQLGLTTKAASEKWYASDIVSKDLSKLNIGTTIFETYNTMMKDTFGSHFITGLTYGGRLSSLIYKVSTTSISDETFDVAACIAISNDPSYVPIDEACKVADPPPDCSGTTVDPPTSNEAKASGSVCATYDSVKRQAATGQSFKTNLFVVGGDNDAGTKIQTGGRTNKLMSDWLNSLSSPDTVTPIDCELLSIWELINNTVVRLVQGGTSYSTTKEQEYRKKMNPTLDPAVAAAGLLATGSGYNPIDNDSSFWEQIAINFKMAYLQKVVCYWSVQEGGSAATTNDWMTYINVIGNSGTQTALTQFDCRTTNGNRCGGVGSNCNSNLCCGLNNCINCNGKGRKWGKHPDMCTQVNISGNGDNYPCNQSWLRCDQINGQKDAAFGSQSFWDTTKLDVDTTSCAPAT
jgi:hypothetical protein